MRMIIISNRLPVVLQKKEDGWDIQTGSGGLVTALSPILRALGGTWIGWPGLTDTEAAGVESPLDEYSTRQGHGLKPVILTENELNGFYYGFSNEIIWPLFHDLQSRCNFVPEYWETYQAVMQKYADVVVADVQAGDFIWVHDYQLMSLGLKLRERGVRNKLGFFLHIPFPPPDIFFKLPWRTEVLENLLGHDIIGFQTPRDRGNFLDCVRKLLKDSRIRRRGREHVVERNGRATVVGTFPIGIDYKEFAEEAMKPATTERMRTIRAQLSDRQVILGVDRLDYTKGIPYRFKAFKLALERFPELHRKTTLFQVVVPSREIVPQYQDLKAEIERLVAQINGAYTQPGWVPIHYVFRDLNRSELVATYRAADVAFVTPLKDGMNLVAKEYCACQAEGNGVLILSEFAGAAVQLDRAILVNPYDLESVAKAINRAVNTSGEQRRRAMAQLRRKIRQQDVHWWARQFLAACGVASWNTTAREEHADPAGIGLPEELGTTEVHGCTS